MTSASASPLALLHVVGARPNFMKLAPVFLAGQARGVAQAVVHTGQHYDRDMSDRFFEELGIPRPDENLDVGSGSHAVQTAEVSTRSWGAFTRSVRLPAPVDGGKVTATFKKGVITITLPKAPGAKGTTIPIKAE